MGKNKKKSGQQPLGALIIKDRFGKKQHRSADSFLHTSELNDGYDWGRLNLQSVTEQNQLDDFLATAELAGTEFAAEKLNIEIVSGPSAAPSLPSELELKDIAEAQEKYQDQLRIPRRPNWHSGMSAEELQSLERDSFLEWRRGLAELQDKEHIMITPFERNLDFWRQLWRVIERSDIVVQIVDSRNPLLFRCNDLEVYVKEVNKDKVNVILVNKSDFLTHEQRQYWCEYFNTCNVKVFFWSAKLETERQEQAEAAEEDSTTPQSDEEDTDDNIREAEEQDIQSGGPAVPVDQDNVTSLVTDTDSLNSPTLYTAEQLIDELKKLRPPQLEHEDVLTIGLVGYPNVGKSSSINAILKAKKCPVSATPGRTKHFQTIYVDSYTMLCDCPGLVMPSFVNTKADMILNGILPIDQMRDHKPAINTMAHRIPRENLEHIYSIHLRKPKEGENPDRPPTDLELLNAYGAMRGFMTASGVPDCPRAARILLKDFVNGKLLYCEPPPGVPIEKFQPTPQYNQKPSKLASKQDVDGATADLDDLDIRVDRSTSKKLDSEFFHQRTHAAHFNGPRSMAIGSDGKPTKKHGNRHKKEKTRRLYAHLDKHDAY